MPPRRPAPGVSSGMALSKEQKEEIKREWEQLASLAEKFSGGTVEELYVVNGEPLIRGAEAMARLLVRVPRASWSRGKQGHRGRGRRP